jgi:16S rRNA (cytosine967-C5)-methyltransferase
MNPRLLALQVLRENRTNHAFAGDLLDEHLARAALSPADRRLATTLVYGVLRRRGTLDALVRPFVRRPLENVEDWLMDALRLGAYQLVLLTHVPPHAALHETVELAARQGRPAAKGFLNGVLRRVAELVPGEPQFTDAPAADAVPLDGGRYRRLAAPVLPDPAADPAGHLIAAFAWPAWLADRWLARYGFDECVRLGMWFAGPAPLWLRANRLKGGRDSLLASLSAAGVAAEPGEHPQSVKLTSPASVRELPGYAEGLFAVQDHSSMRVASALAPEPGMRVLDLCAAPGGKSTHLAELMDDRGRVVACDPDANRLRTVSELARRLGLTAVETRTIDPAGPPPEGPFDAALADVPCSNTGVLGRRPEVRWRLSPGELPHLVALQTRLLRAAVSRVRPGGVVVYSTCSVEPEENGGVVRAVLAGRGDLRLEAEEASAPGRPADGGYWARLRVGGD